MSGVDRRRFLQLSAGALVAASDLEALSGSANAQGVGTSQPSAAWPPEAIEYRFHMVANSHVDATWLWPWQEGASVVMSTFRSMLKTMEEYPDFTFTASAAQYYEWVAETDPKMLEEISRRVAEGRWAIVGGWWIEPDVNMPSGEAFMRQGLYGQRVFQRLFGRTARVGYNPDGFGHAGTIPQILKLQRMDSYVFMRPHAKAKTLPQGPFWWEAPDGTRVMGYRVVDYANWGDVEPRIREIMALSEPTNDRMDFYGAGDHGGAVTGQNLASIQKVRNEAGSPAIVLSTPERYFAEIQSKPGSELPVVKDELQHEFVGCYTAMSEVKKNNRETELFLVASERLSALASVIANYEYPHSAFDKAWQRVLFLQFHDSLCGTACPEHYRLARDGYGSARDAAQYSLYRAAEKILWQVPAEDPESEYLVVFNPHGWPATLNVEYDLDWTPPGPSLLECGPGHQIAHQWTQASVVEGWIWGPIVDRNKLVFRAPLPAFGYQQFRLRHDQEPAETGSVLHASEQGMENEHLRVTFLNDGSADIFDKDVGQRVFWQGTGGQRGVIVDDQSDTWGNGVNAYDKEIGAFEHARFRIMENGPVRVCVRVYTNYGSSSMQTDWLLYAGTRSLETRVALDWHEHLKMLKFSYPIDVREPQATYEIPYGHITRQTDGLENPGQRWLDVSGKRGDSSYGFATINDAKYGYSVRDSDLRISVVRGVVYAWEEPNVGKLKPDGEYQWQDQGLQTFRTLLMPHAGNWKDAAVVRAAEEFTTVVPVIYQGIHSGTRSQSASFMSVDAPNVVASVLKKAEDNDDLILRCYETGGEPTRATVNLSFLNQHWTGNFRPCEIKTLRISSSRNKIVEVDALESTSTS